MSEKYEKNVYLAMLAEQCNRFDDMMMFLEDMVKSKKEGLSSDERNLLSIAYKNSISLRRQALRTLLAYELKEKKKEESLYLNYIIEYKQKVEKELIELCKKIVSNIEEHLLPKSGDDEAKVFYHKMKGDYYRYVAENLEGDDKTNYANQSLKAYQEASNTATSLAQTNAIRLGLALNFSVFYYEVMNDQEKACNVAKETLELSKKELAGIDEDDEEYKDTFSIVNLLEENLNMWTIEADNN
jgi:14-3-3 protein epsilon